MRAGAAPSASAQRYGPAMPHQPVPSANRAFARTMRREPTEAEERLWRALRDRRLDGAKFRRQVPLPPYVADFLCAEAMLIVEVDGSQHGDSVADEARTRFLHGKGFRVLRFWNDEVLREIGPVCDMIVAYLRDRNLKPWR